MKENKEKNDLISLLSVVICLTTFILIILSTMLTSYSTKVKDKEKIVETKKNISISYENGNEIILKNIKPGTDNIINFEISSLKDSSDISNYEIYFDIESSDFNPEYLYYQISSSSSLGMESGELVSTEMLSFSNYDTPHYKGSVKPGETQEYFFKITYDTGTTVKKNNLKGHIQINYTN